MQTAATIAQTMLRFTGLVQIVLGLLFWLGRARSMVAVHMLLGFVLVLALWALAVLAAHAGASVAIVGLALAWGVLVVVLGMAQARLLPGNGHWVVQAMHLLVGLVAIGLGEALAIKIRTSQMEAPRRRSAAKGSGRIA